MRIIPILLAIVTTNICVCQETAPAANAIAAKSAESKRLPAYAVYGHFLAWVNQLDKAAAASGATDPYKFAEPFSRAHLQSQHLDLIQKEARALDADLRRKDASAKAIIARYRERGKLALAEGKPLPPLPPEITQLQRERTAILVQHYVALRSALGTDVTARLDRYLGYEFAPHIKLTRMSPPGQPVARQAGPSIPAQSVTAGQQ